jgi:hypothetical protein
MYKCLLILLFGGLFASPALGQEQAFTVFLLGDAGNWTQPNTLLNSYKAALDATPNSASILLGDNIYPKGMLNNSKKRYAKECLKMNLQLDVARDYKGYFYVIPGNHDWRAGKFNGVKSVIAQQKYVDSVLLFQSKIANKRQAFYPTQGLPGPDFIDINNTIRLLFIDTQWWLQTVNFHKVPYGANRNKKETEADFYAKLDSLIADANARKLNVIAAFHHPILPSGVNDAPELMLHAFNYSPLQVFGLLGVNRLLSQATNQKRYKKMANKLFASFDNCTNCIVVSGHEHILFYKQKNKVKQLVVGAGSKHPAFDYPKNNGIFFRGGIFGFAQIIIKNGTTQVLFKDEKGEVIYQE